MGNSTSCGCFSCKTVEPRGGGHHGIPSQDGEEGPRPDGIGNLTTVNEGGLTASLQHIMDREKNTDGESEFS